MEPELLVRFEDGIVIADYGHTLVIRPQQSWDLLKLAAPQVERHSGPFGVIVIATSISLLFGDFRPFMHSPEVAKVTAALAIVTHAALTKQFFKQMTNESKNLSYPVRHFTQTAEAKAWLGTVV